MSHYENAWQAVLQRIEAASRAAGRAPGDVRLLAVAKTFPAAAVRALYELGQRAFGENYVQEAAAKRESLRDLPDVEWHMIGPLQSNKTALAAVTFDWVESVDRLKIAQRLSAQRPEGMAPLELCIEVNVSGEASKGGVAPGEVLALAQAIASLPNLRLRGIMGIPAATDDPAVLHGQFRALRESFDRLHDAGLAADTLSMGMSADLEAAIAEGSTQVRVGTALFGARS
jgi:pyridoxal phosphate enzyme (YggS family)